MAEQVLPPMGPEDYVILAETRVHVMRYGGRNEDGRRFWQLACGSKLSDENWGCVY